MKKIVTLILFQTLFITGFTQEITLRDEILSQNIAWAEGSVMLKDGSELKGVLRYNDNTGVLNYENGKDSRSLTAKSVVAFEFFDEAEQRQRIFYSQPFTDPEVGIKRTCFFEVLKELKGFTVVSKTDAVKIDQKSNSAPVFETPAAFRNPNHTTSPRLDYSQSETLCLMSADGSIHPLLRIVETDIDRAMFDRTKTKNKLLDDKLLKQFTGQYFEKLEAYAKEKDLSFKRKQDLLQILSYYQELVAN